MLELLYPRISNLLAVRKHIQYTSYHVLPSHCYRPVLELLYPRISNLLAVKKHIHVVYQLSWIAITLLQASARTTLPRILNLLAVRKHIQYTSYHVLPSHCYRPVLEQLYPGISNLLAVRKKRTHKTSYLNPFTANRSGIPVVHILQPICHNDGFLRLLVSHIPMVVKDMWCHEIF